MRKIKHIDNDSIVTLSLPDELDHFKAILVQAAQSGKYDPDNWLEPDGKKQDKKSQYDSIMHHILAHVRGEQLDKESGLDHRLHATVRLMMDYTRDKRGIKHPIDRLGLNNLDVELSDELKRLNRSGNEGSGIKYGSGDT